MRNLELNQVELIPSLAHEPDKLYCPNRGMGLFAICFLVACGTTALPRGAVGQMQLQGPKTTTTANPGNNDSEKSGWRAATFRTELVPFSPRTDVNEREEFAFTSSANIENVESKSTVRQSVLAGNRFERRIEQDGNGSSAPLKNQSNTPSIPSSLEDRFDYPAPMRQTSTQVAPTATTRQEPAGLASQEQTPAIRLLGEDLESLPSPFSGIDEDDENVVIQRFDNGDPQVIRHVAQDDNGNYYNHGPWEARNQAGQTVAQGNYVRGKMDGQWVRIHDKNSSSLFSTKPFNLFQGPFRSVARFKAGKLDGFWTIYDQYQTKIFEIQYQEGVRHGVATWFYPNAGRMREATFKQGLIHGEILDFDDSEKIAKRQEYVDGRPIVRNTTFYRPTVKKSEDYYLGKKLEPKDTDDWWTAKPAPYVEIGGETQNGSAMSWYENGQPKKRGQYTNGQPVGQFVWWHANGNKQAEGFYVAGQKNRRWTWWFENGMKQFEGEFEDEQPVGIWRSWHPDGELRKEKDYAAESEPGLIVEPEADSSTAQNPTSQNQNDDTPNAEDPFSPNTSPAEPDINGPKPGTLPPPKNASPAIDEPKNLETITPLDFRSPATPSDAPTENSTKPSTENSTESKTGEVGEIPMEIIEG